MPCDTFEIVVKQKDSKKQFTFYRGKNSKGESVIVVIVHENYLFGKWPSNIPMDLYLEKKIEVLNNKPIGIEVLQYNKKNHGIDMQWLFAVPESQRFEETFGFIDNLYIELQEDILTEIMASNISINHLLI